MADERSPWLVPGLLALGILAVAAGSVVVAFATTAAFPERPPEKPGTLTRENVTEFVQRYEHARVYDQIADGATRVEIDCEAGLLNETDRGFRVSVACEGYASGPNFDADYAAKPVRYLVNESTTRRLRRIDRRAGERDSPSQLSPSSRRPAATAPAPTSAPTP